MRNGGRRRQPWQPWQRCNGGAVGGTCHGYHCPAAQAPVPRRHRVKPTPRRREGGQRLKGKLQSAHTHPAGAQHSCQPTVKLHILPLVQLVWIFTLLKGVSTGAHGAAGIYLGLKGSPLCKVRIVEGHYRAHPRPQWDRIMSAHSKTPYVTPIMDISSGNGVVGRGMVWYGRCL